MENDQTALKEISPPIVGDEVSIGGKHYLTPQKLADILGVTRRTLARWTAARIGPLKIKVAKPSCTTWPNFPIGWQAVRPNRSVAATVEAPATEMNQALLKHERSPAGNSPAAGGACIRTIPTETTMMARKIILISAAATGNSESLNVIADDGTLWMMGRAGGDPSRWQRLPPLPHDHGHNDECRR